MERAYFLENKYFCALFTKLSLNCLPKICVMPRQKLNKYIFVHSEATLHIFACFYVSVCLICIKWMWHVANVHCRCGWQRQQIKIHRCCLGKRDRFTDRTILDRWKICGKWLIPRSAWLMCWLGHDGIIFHFNICWNGNVYLYRSMNRGKII